MARRDWMIRESELLDDIQLDVLRETIGKSLVVSGCAGSGKSVLALIKAQHLQSREKNYEVIVFTKALCQYMDSGRNELKLNGPIFYYQEWKNRGMPQADYVIVDEIQDFTREEIEEFIEAAREHFFFFGDTAQSIYNGLPDGNGGDKKTMPVDNIRDLFPPDSKPKSFELYRNYRLPKAVAKLVQHIGVDLPEYVDNRYKSTETAVPYILGYKTEEEQLNTIKETIQQKSLTDVAVLLPQNEFVKDVANKLTQLGLNCEMKYNDKQNWHNNQETLNFSTENVKVMTYHSAKGLQFETVFLPYMERYNAFRPSARTSLYVAATRAYKNLYFLYSGPMPSIFGQIDSSLYKTSTTETVDDI